MRRTLREKVRGYGRTHPVWLRLGPITVVTALFAANLLSYARAHGAHGWLLALCGCSSYWAPASWRWGWSTGW